MTKTNQDLEIYWHVRDFKGVKSIIKSRDSPKGFQMTSPGCETLEASKEKWGMPEKPCVECGYCFSTNYCEPYKTILLRDNVCMGCNHWRDMAKHNGNPNQAIVAGRHYLICADTSEPSSWKGHGGAKFTIQFDDGRKVVTTNLWNQGDIPDHFKDRLKDNAVFVV